jgi:hypothetical protein
MDEAPDYSAAYMTDVLMPEQAVELLESRANGKADREAKRVVRAFRLTPRLWDGWDSVMTKFAGAPGPPSSKGGRT